MVTKVLQVLTFDLYDAAILNKDYQVTFKKSASGKYLMLWATDTAHGW